MQYLGAVSKITMISTCFHVKSLNITVIQVYDPTTDAKEAKVDWFCEDLQHILELTPKKDVIFIIGNLNTKVGSQKIPGITDKFGLEVQNKAGQSLKELCQENMKVIANTYFQQPKG